jgi:hypothetical protein
MQGVLNNKGEAMTKGFSRREFLKEGMLFVIWASLGTMALTTACDKSDNSTDTGTQPPIAKAVTPTFQPPPGSYTSPRNIQILCGTSGATIRYTVDGSEPNASSMIYSVSITITRTTTIKAKAFKVGLVDSDTASATYAIM